MTSHLLPMLGCLALGTADLAFIDAVVLPRVVQGASEPGRGSETPPPDVRGGGRPGGGASSHEDRRAAVAVPPPVAAPAPPREAPPPVEAPPAPPPAPTLALTIHFNTGEAALNPRARAAVEALVARMADHPGWTLAVEGHADARGDAALNERLSQERAQMVAARLERLGLPASRVQMAAFGATRPLTAGDDPAALRRNRRVEILIARGEP